MNDLEYKILITLLTVVSIFLADHWLQKVMSSIFVVICMKMLLEN